MENKPRIDMSQGTWVARFEGRSEDRPMIGRVHEAYTLDGSTLLDIVLYSSSGNKIGRESPACGGPRGFEPACPAEHWVPIEKPDFEFIRDKSFYGRHLRQLRTAVPA